MNNSCWVRQAKWIVTLALASTLLGCVDQAKEVATYRKQLDALPGVAATPVPTDNVPLNLQDALRLAEKNDESLNLSGEAYLQALIAKDREFSAFLPQISLGPSLNESQPQRGRPGPIHSFTVPLNASGNLFNGFRDQAALEADTATIEQQRQLLLNEQQTILLDVVQAYYAVLQAERSVIVDQSSLAEQDELVRQSLAKQNVGSGTPLAVAQSQSQASSTRVQLIQAEATVKTSRAALAFLIGSPAETRSLTDGFESPPADRPIDAWLVEAELARQDLAATDAAVAAARQQVRVAIGEYYPSVTLDLNYLIYHESEPLNERLSGSLSANIPIFTGGQIEADVRSAFSQLRSALLNQSQARKQVRDDIRTAYANLQSSRDQIKELRVELKANRDALVYAQQEFNVGLAINLDVLTAQAELLSTQLNLATQVYQEKSAYMNLLRVSGRLTLAAAAPTARSSTEPSDIEEITTPQVITRPTTVPAPLLP